MSKTSKKYSIYPIRTIIIGGLILSGLFTISLFRPSLYHFLVEILSVIIAANIFIIAWHTRKFTNNFFILFIGIAALFFGIINIFHTITAEGINLIEGFSTNASMQLKLSARYLEGLSFLIALFFLKRKFNTPLVFIGYIVLVTLLFVSIFYWQNFPTTFEENTGSTLFKKINEYTISFLFLVAIFLLFKNRKHFSINSLTWLTITGFALITSSLLLSLVKNPYDLPYRASHIFEVISAYALYRTFIRKILTNPQETIFKKIESKNIELEKINSDLIEEKEKTEKAIKEAEKIKIEMEKALKYSENLNRSMIGRELKMVELKKEIKKLQK